MALQVQMSIVAKQLESRLFVPRTLASGTHPVVPVPMVEFIIRGQDETRECNIPGHFEECAQYIHQLAVPQSTSLCRGTNYQIRTVDVTTAALDTRFVLE